MNPIDIRFLKMKFSFESETGEIEDHRFINKFMIDIYGCNMLDNHQLEKPAEVLIGKAVVYQFLLEYMIREDYSIYALFTSCGEARDVGHLLLNEEKNDFNDKYEELLTDSSTFNVLYLDRVMLYPEYRGYGYGKFIIKDIIGRFYDTVGLVMTKVFPLQLELFEKSARMEYYSMDQDMEYSSFKLYNYFLNLGFEQENQSDYFYLRTSFPNDKLARIDLNSIFDQEYYDKLVKQR